MISLAVSTLGAASVDASPVEEKFLRTTITESNIEIILGDGNFSILNNTRKEIIFGEPVVWEMFVSDGRDIFSIIYETPPINVKITEEIEGYDWIKTITLETEYGDSYYDISLETTIAEKDFTIHPDIDYELNDELISIFLPQFIEKKEIVIEGVLENITTENVSVEYLFLQLVINGTVQEYFFDQNSDVLVPMDFFGTNYTIVNVSRGKIVFGDQIHWELLINDGFEDILVEYDTQPINLDIFDYVNESLWKKEVFFESGFPDIYTKIPFEIIIPDSLNIDLKPEMDYEVIYGKEEQSIRLIIPNIKDVNPLIITGYFDNLTNKTFNQTFFTLNTFIENTYFKDNESLEFIADIPLEFADLAYQIYETEKQIKKIEKSEIDNVNETEKFQKEEDGKSSSVEEEQILQKKQEVVLRKQLLEEKLDHKFSGKLFFKDQNVQSIEFDDLFIDENSVNLGVKDINHPMSAQGYAIDPENLNFTNATVTVVAKGTELYKCKDWDFATDACLGDWELFKEGLIPGEEYTFELTKEDPGFIEINISNAVHLDANKSFLSNIYEDVRDLDDIWSEPIYHGEYVRVTFEQNLTNENDITIYPKNNQSLNTSVHVFYYNSDEKIMEFPVLNEQKFYQKYLSNMVGEHDKFDLRIVNLNDDNSSYLEFDYITDPITGGATTGGLRPQTVLCYSYGIPAVCLGTYPNTCAAGDRLSCNDGSQEEHITQKNDLAGVQANYSDSTVLDCLEITKVDVCYEWYAQRTDPDDCEISIDNDAVTSWSEINSTCPGTSTVSACQDVTSEEGGWTCSNFFGASGSKAKIRALQDSPGNRVTTIYIDQLWYNVSYISAGTIDSTMNNPDTTKQNNYTLYNEFEVNITLTCLGSGADYSCGKLNASLRYNTTTATPDTQISTVEGTQPFYADLGLQTCPRLNATAGQNTCYLAWEVNVTQQGKWNIDVFVQSEFSNVDDNKTDNALIKVFGPPKIQINLTEPTSPKNIEQGSNFEINCTSYCSGQECQDVNTYLIYCSSSECVPSDYLNTTSSGLFANYDNISLGNIAEGSSSVSSFDITTQTNGDYIVACQANTTNTGLVNSLPNNLSVGVNAFPIAIFQYPSPADWLSSIEILNSSSTDSDGTITNYLYELDDNLGFATPSTICNSSDKNCTFNTSDQSECSEESSSCYIKLTVTDDDNAQNSTKIQVGIDNIGPLTHLIEPLNNTYIIIESQLVNATASDSGSGVDCVEYSYYNGTWNSLDSVCSSPYEYTWDLSSVPDKSNLSVRARANDTEGNLGGYYTNVNITHDTTLPTVVLDSPTGSEIININPYILNASSSSDATSGIRNASWYFYNTTSLSWQLIGSDTTPEDGLTYSWNILMGDGKYNISVNVSDQAGFENFVVVENVVIDVINLNPSCIVNYPNGAENLSDVVAINASVSELDPSDGIYNLTFEYSLDNGGSWDIIGANLTQNLTEYGFNWDTSSDVDGIGYLVRCTAYDFRSGSGQDTSNNNFTIDNTAPILSNPNINKITVLVNKPICLNVTVTDNIVGVDLVLAEINPDMDDPLNLTLRDNGTGCDILSGDNIYSANYLSPYETDYNWTRAYANDYIGNLNSLNVGLTWNASTLAYINLSMIEPLVNIEINESNGNSKYNQTCNASCDPSGSNCKDVVLSAQYKPSSWTKITTLTSDLINSIDNYGCGNLSINENCVYTFEIQSGLDSGNNKWPIRCYVESSNAEAAFSNIINLTINDLPIAIFQYPSPADWLSSIEILNSSSTDSDGTITNYLYELDDNLGFATPSTICNSSDKNCTFNTSDQSECSEESSSCYIKLTVTDDDNAQNSTKIQVGIDNIGPLTHLIEPLNNTYIIIESQLVNATASDSGSGVDCVEYSYYNGTWNSLDSVCSSPYEYTWDLSSVPDKSNLSVRARANDTEGNLGGYYTNVNITHDTGGVSIDLHYPSDEEYINSDSFSINFTVIDNLDLILSCDLYLDGIFNTTNSSCLWGELTYFDLTNLEEKQYEWFINCSDSASNSLKSEVRNFTIDTTPPTVGLDYPEEDVWFDSSSLEFNYTPTDLYLDNCELWGNWSSGWHLNKTEINPVNESENSFALTILDGDGHYEWNVKCNDSAGNYAFNSSNKTFNIDITYPQIYFDSSTIEDGKFSSQNSVLVNATVIDNNIDKVLLEWDSVNESFDNNNGNSYYEIKTPGEGQYSFKAYINDSSGNINFTELRVVTVDLTSPNWTNQDQKIKGVSANDFHRGDIFVLSSDWKDNYGLSKTFLETDESGNWKNLSSYDSPNNLTGLSDSISFNWVNNTLNLGNVVSWRIYANDSAGNMNRTDVKNFTLWGWSEVSSAYFSPTTVDVAGTSIFSCVVQDNYTNQGLENYTVYFYNETNYLGFNDTNAEGIASITRQFNIEGVHQFTCNISDENLLYYNNSDNDEGQASLTVGSGISIFSYSETAPHVAYEGTASDTTTLIDDPIGTLENDNNNYQEYTYDGSSGFYAYTRFEMYINNSFNSIQSFNVTWMGYGNAGNNNPGYSLSIYNYTSKNWYEFVTYIVDATEQTEEFYVSSITKNDFMNSSNGEVMILARSYYPAPTTSGQKWATIATDYIELEVIYDVQEPQITLNIPTTNYKSNSSVIDFSCYVEDNIGITNVSLYGNWSGWHNNQTNSSGLNNLNYNFTQTLLDGEYLWNCYSCDKSDLCSFALFNGTFSIDTIAPTSSLTSPNNNSIDVDGNILVTCVGNDTKSLDRVELYINSSLNDTLALTGLSDSDIFNVYNLSDGDYELECRVYDEHNNSNRSFTYIDVDSTVVPIYSSFNGSTTSWLTVPNILNICDGAAILEMVGIGKIQWDGCVNAYNANFDTDIEIINNTIDVDSLSLDSSFNSSAQITLEGLGWEVTPLIYTDGKICPVEVCSNISYNSGTGIAIFNVTHFTNYTTKGNTKMNIWDETDSDKDNLVKIRNENVRFYSNYTFRNNGLPVTGATCTINFSDSQQSMSYNLSTTIYYYDRSFSSPGIKSYNVTCSGAGAQTIKLSDFANITAKPDFDILDITYSVQESEIIEGNNLTIYVNVTNIGSKDESNLTLRFNISHFDLGSWKWNKTHEETDIILSINQTKKIIFNWIADVGLYQFLAIADPQNLTSEESEINNQYLTNISVSTWEIFYGNFSYNLILDTFNNESFMDWTMDIPMGNSYFSDIDASYFPSDLLPLNGANDLDEADTALGMTWFNDSISNLFDRDGNGVADNTRTIKIGSTNVENIPIVNSTDSSTFITGLLYDSADGVGYDGNQDLIFITVINSSQQGRYGIYDYEVRIPSPLEKLEGALNEVYRLDELK